MYQTAEYGDSKHFGMMLAHELGHPLHLYLEKEKPDMFRKITEIHTRLKKESAFIGTSGFMGLGDAKYRRNYQKSIAEFFGDMNMWYLLFPEAFNRFINRIRHPEVRRDYLSLYSMFDRIYSTNQESSSVLRRS